MSWYKRDKEGITTSTTQKKETPDGVWHQCRACKKTCTTVELKNNLMVCPHCGRHERIGSKEYFNLIFDESRYKVLFDDIISEDFMGFKDLKTYTERLKGSYMKTGLSSAITVARGRVFRLDLVIAAMDFRFIGGSMGSVMGEKIARAIDYCIEKKMPLMIISASGGARMMESAFSLMQMAKISAKLTQLADAGLPYLSFLTDPTTGGVSASFAMLGDLNFAEPNALIAFAGPRVIKETLRIKELPEGFQRAESVLETGFLDFIVERKNLRNKISDILFLFKRS
ncbi:MAG: acetyl-CoA carboxylase, carboxyltransferase subunit beta [Saprospiraceae bacterium]|nr:acetyl-CoA carboxylase, carboxyltransferase subunit beta [Saprospiraceae bacterium]